MPGCHGISGNEAAEWLARAGSACLFTCSKPFSWPLTLGRYLVDTWEWDKISHNWTEAPGIRQAKQLITLLPLKVDFIMLLRRLELRTFTSLLLLVTYCKERVETAEHILCYCKATIAQKQLQYTLAEPFWGQLSYASLPQGYFHSPPLN